MRTKLYGNSFNFFKNGFLIITFHKNRSCPECRVQSDFVCPSRYWCETKEEKEKLITDYKQALRYLKNAKLEFEIVF